MNPPTPLPRRRAAAGALLLGLAATLSVAAATQQQPPAGSPYPRLGRIVRSDPRLDKILPPGAQIEVLASGFDWSEGPVWLKTDPLGEQGGCLLFSDVPRNHVLRWKEGEGISVFLQPSGYTGRAPYGREPGSNGLTLDRQGRLVSCEHGDRRVSVLLWDGGKKTLADSYAGKRFNSPNDVVVKSDGSVYFTDPPYGLPRQADDPRREQPHFGVYRITPDGTVTLLTAEMTRPNGLAFSPDEKTLYVAQSDPDAAIWKAFPVQADGTLGNSRVFFDATSMAKSGTMKGLPDGLKVDRDGNLWATGPGGVLIFAPDGTLLGRIDTGEATANCAFGGSDGSDLYITADMYLCRVRTTAHGADVH
jgi:gluconolactonase